MVGSPRVDFSPIFTTGGADGRSFPVVFGGRLRGFNFGPTPPATPGPVELVFSAEYLTRARNAEVSAVGEFAKLPGELVVTNTGAEIQVIAEKTLPIEQLSEIPDQDHPVVGKLPPLSLTLELGDGFQTIPAETKKEGQNGSAKPSANGTSNPVKTTTDAAPASLVPPIRGRLFIPPPDKPSKYLELMVTVKRDGADLAPAAANGRLDVSLLLLDFLVFSVEDEKGKTAPDVDVELELTNGEQITGKTDQDGRFAINGVPRGECGVLLPLGIQIKDQEKSETNKAS